MPHADPIKTSFASGELGPPLFGRTDIAQYQNACETVENMLCRPYGSAISTPGTEYLREVKDSSKRTRVIPFIFNRTDANIIEMGDEYMRFFIGASALVSAPLTLDYMEYTSSATVQTTYITSDGPTEASDQSLSAGSANEYFAYPGRPDVFQIFKAGSTGRLTKFSIDMKLFASDPVLTLTGKVYSASGTAPTTLLANFSTVTTSTLTGTYASISFTKVYAEAPALVSGTTYALVVRASGTSGINYINVNHGGTYANGNWGYGDTNVFYGQSGDIDFETFISSVPNLIATSETSIVQQGLYSLKVVATSGGSLNDTLTRTIASPIDLSNASQVNFYFRASRTGSNIKIGIHDAGGTTTEYTPSVSTVSTWTSYSIDLSAVTAANKDAIDSIIITVTNADADNTFYLDDMYGLFSEITTPYSEDEIFDVQYAQSNDVIYMAHKSYPPKKLTRLSASSWTFADFDFLGGPYLPDNLTAITITPSATAGSITITLSATNSSTYFRSSGSTVGHIGSYWRIGGSLTSSTTGLDVQGYVKITSITSATIAVATVIKTLDSSSATTNWSEGAWSAVRGYPARITFHEKRLCFARTDTEPQNIWMSKSFLYDDFGVNSGNDDDALNVTLASAEANEVMWLASSEVLAVGTFGGDFVISNGGTGEALTPANATSNSYSSWGSSAITPKKVGSFFYYVQRFGKKLRELSYSYDFNTYKSMDKTILSPHITGTGIVDLAYQQNPDTILWCVRSDGTIATFTREIDQEVQAWSRQVTDGAYESVACIPSTTEAYDEVWVVVRRTINGETKRYIEVFGNLEYGSRVDALWYVHCGLEYSAYDNTSASTLTLSATNGSITLTLSATTSTTYFESNDVGQRVRAIDSAGATLGEATITSYSSSTIAVASVSTIFSLPSYSGMYWGKSVQVISGLSHLEGAEVVALVDGGLDNSNKTVSNGSITLGRDYFVAIIGLPYTQTLKTLPIEAGSAKGTAQGKIQRINQIGFKVNNSYVGFYHGGATAHLQRLVYRSPATALGTPETLFTGVKANKTFKGGPVIGAQILIQNTDPLPMEILSIMPSLTTEDR